MKGTTVEFTLLGKRGQARMGYRGEGSFRRSQSIEKMCKRVGFRHQPEKGQGGAQYIHHIDLLAPYRTKPLADHYHSITCDHSPVLAAAVLPKKSFSIIRLLPRLAL